MQAHPLHAAEALLRLPAVEARTGLKKSAIYAGIKDKTFPACVKLGRASAWPSSSIDRWIAERIADSRRGAR